MDPSKALDLPRSAVQAVLDDTDIPEHLMDMLREFGQPRIENPRPGVYVARGFGLANSTMLEGPDGCIIVDTMDTLEAGRKVHAAFREHCQKPIRAIVYTHNHQDHTEGTKAFIEDPTNPPQVWAHEKFPEELEKMQLCAPLFYLRGSRQFGVFVGRGVTRLGCFDVDREAKFVTPKYFVKGEGQDATIAGLKIEFVHIPGETDDQMGVWIPDWKTFMCADDLYKAFPNISAIRGTTNRDALQWAESIRKIESYKPEVLLTGHTSIIKGEDQIGEILRIYRKGILSVHNQTVDLMNQGLHVEDIVRRVKLPEDCASSPYLKEMYGTVEWSVRGIFNGYVGWFSGDPAELSPLERHDKARCMIDLGGGVEKVLGHAQEAHSVGNHQWALELTSHVALLYPMNEQAMKIKVDAMKKLAGKQTSFNGRNYYLTCAVESLAPFMKDSNM